MKHKELKNLAKKIAEQEKLLQQATTKEEKEKAENEIMRLSSSVKTIEDIITLDELIQEML